MKKEFRKDLGKPVESGHKAYFKMGFQVEYWAGGSPLAEAQCLISEEPSDMDVKADRTRMIQS